MHPRDGIATRVVVALAWRGKRPVDLARAFGVTTSTMAAFLSGLRYNREPGSTAQVTVERIAEHLKIPPDCLRPGGSRGPLVGMPPGGGDAAMTLLARADLKTVDALRAGEAVVEPLPPGWIVTMPMGTMHRLDANGITYQLPNRTRITALVGTHARLEVVEA